MSHPVVNQATPSLTELTLLCGSLCNVVERSFGPSHQHTLLAASNGSILLSKDATTLLNSLHFSHPFAKFIVDVLNSFSKTYGDGCKSVLIYLHELVAAVEKDLYVKENVGAGGNISKNYAARAFQNFLNQDLDQIFKTANIIAACENIKNAKEQSFSKSSVLKIVKSCLSGILEDSVENFLSNLIASFVFEDQEKRFNELAFSHIDHILFTAQGLSIEASTLVSGVLLRGVVHESSKTQAYNIRSIILNFDFEDVGNKSTETIHVCGELVAKKVLSHKFYSVRQFFLNLKKLSILCIYSGKKIPSYALQICSSLEISAFILDDEDDIEFLAFLTNCSPLTSIFDNVLETQVFLLSHMESFSLGTLNCIRAVFPDFTSHCKIKTLVITVPLQSLDFQVKHAVRKCVKSLKNCSQKYAHANCELLSQLSLDCEERCISDDDKVDMLEESLSKVKPDGLKNKNKRLNTGQTDQGFILSTVPGGGCFEFILSKCLSDYSKNNVGLSGAQKFCCKVIRQMLLAVPCSLFSNLSSRNGGKWSKKHFVEIEQEVLKASSSGMKMGLNSYGEICDSTQSDSVDVLAVKCAAVVCAINLFIQLMRIDVIIGVKGSVDTLHDKSDLLNQEEDSTGS